MSNEWILTDGLAFDPYGNGERTCRFCTLITSAEETRPDYLHAPGCRLRSLLSTPQGEQAGEEK